jgi:hypothetical protein
MSWCKALSLQAAFSAWFALLSAVHLKKESLPWATPSTVARMARRLLSGHVAMMPRRLKQFGAQRLPAILFTPPDLIRRLPVPMPLSSQHSAFARYFERLPLRFIAPPPPTCP